MTQTPTHALVPREPTHEMEQEGYVPMSMQDTSGRVYQTMIYHAPNAGKVSREQLWKCIAESRLVSTQDAMQYGADIIAALHALGLQIEGEE